MAGQKDVPLTFLISRTDSIGDCVVTLPLAAWLKVAFPNCRVWWLGAAYTKPVVDCSPYVDVFIILDEAKQPATAFLLQQVDVAYLCFPTKGVAKLLSSIGIPTIIGTANRWYNWLYCTNLAYFSRKKSELHEGQLNFKLVAQLEVPSLETIRRTTKLIAPLPTEDIGQYLGQGQPTIILHPKSKGSAREWPAINYLALTQHPPLSNYHFVIGGTGNELDLIKSECPALLKSTNVSIAAGRLTLTNYMALIAASDGLVACSTGPLHIAASLGIFALGLYPRKRPMHPGRWAPLGPKTEMLLPPLGCPLCKDQMACNCVENISVDTVAQRLLANLPASLDPNILSEGV